MADSVFAFLALPWVPWALSTLLALAAAAIWINFRYNRLEPVLTGLDEAIAVIEESEGQASFRQRFSPLFKRLAENPVVGETWRAYAPTLTVPPGSEDAVGYTRRPEESFNETLLTLAGINLRFYHAVPNMLVGAGLLFTFIGLVAALYFASAGVAAADVKVAQGALRELLAAATFKFATSIAGLASSLVFSWREKDQLHRVTRRIAHLCSALEARMVPVTSESVAAAQLAELRQQNTQLRRITRDLLVRLPEGIEEGITAELRRAMAPLREAMELAAPQVSRIAAPLTELMAAELARQTPAATTLAQGKPVPSAAPAAETAAPPGPEAGSGGGIDRQLRLAGALRQHLDEAFASVRIGLDRLWGKRGDPREAERLKRVERLLNQGREQLRTARAIAEELERALAARAAAALSSAGQDAAADTEAMEALLQQVDESVRGAARQLADAVGELQRDQGR